MRGWTALKRWWMKRQVAKAARRSRACYTWVVGARPGGWRFYSIGDTPKFPVTRQRPGQYVLRLDREA